MTLNFRDGGWPWPLSLSKVLPCPMNPQQVGFTHFMFDSSVDRSGGTVCPVRILSVENSAIRNLIFTVME